MGMSSIDDCVKPVNGKLVKVKLTDLHYQYIPVVTPADIWGNDMALPTSPHVELLILLREMGKPGQWDWSRIFASRYGRERRRRREIGLANWTDDHIREHILKRWKTYGSMLAYGWQRGLYKDRPVRILAEPFWKTRFGGTPEWVDGMEIWDGGGRCAAAHVLGWDTISVQMVRDRKPGSGDCGAFARKLAAVQGVWPEGGQ